MAQRCSIHACRARRSRRLDGFSYRGDGTGKDKEPLAGELGAYNYIDSTAADPAEAQGNGGGMVNVAAVTSGEAIAVVAGLGRNGKLLIVGLAMERVQTPNLTSG